MGKKVTMLRLPLRGVMRPPGLCYECDVAIPGTGLRGMRWKYPERDLLHRRTQAIWGELNPDVLKLPCTRRGGLLCEYFLEQEFEEIYGKDLPWPAKGLYLLHELAKAQPEDALWQIVMQGW